MSTDSRTGSALIQYDPTELDPLAMLDLLREADNAFATVQLPAHPIIRGTSVSSVAHTVENRFRSANASVSRATQGHVDLRVLFPIALGGLAVRQVTRQGLGLRNAPWYVLAYYAFDSFVKLHGDGTRRETT